MLVYFVKAERNIYGETVRLWQRGSYHYEIECEGQKLDVYQPVEEALMCFQDVVNGYPLLWIKNETNTH
jgi:hypothetical protein